VSKAYINKKKSHRKVLHFLFFERKVRITWQEVHATFETNHSFCRKLGGQGTCANFWNK